MALIIEDGSIVAGANSYITVAEYTAWADARFGADRSTAPATEAAAEQLILRGMDVFESKSFKGVKSSSTQSLQWPRLYVDIDDYLVASNEMPTQVKTSLYELTYAEEQGNSDFSAISQKVKREKAGPVEIEYADNSSSATINRSVSATMRKLLVNGGNLGVFRI